MPNYRLALASLIMLPAMMAKAADTTTSSTSALTLLSEYQSLVNKFDTNDDDTLNSSDLTNMPEYLQTQLKEQLSSKFSLDDSLSLSEQLSSLQEKYGSVSATESTLKASALEKLQSLESAAATTATSTDSSDESEESSLLEDISNLKSVWGN